MPTEAKNSSAEQVAQRHDVAERLVAVVRLAEHHAGHEGAEGERQPHQVGRVADAEADGGDGQQEQLARSATRRCGAIRRGSSLVPEHEHRRQEAPRP